MLRGGTQSETRNVEAFLRQLLEKGLSCALDVELECDECSVDVEDGRDLGHGLDLLLGEEYQNREPRQTYGDRENSEGREGVAPGREDGKEMRHAEDVRARFVFIRCQSLRAFVKPLSNLPRTELR